VKQDHQLGDLILATPVFRALKEHNPALTLHFVGRPYNVPAVETNRRLDRVITLDKR